MFVQVSDSVEVASTGVAAASGSIALPKFSVLPDTVQALLIVAVTWKVLLAVAA